MVGAEFGRGWSGELDMEGEFMHLFSEKNKCRGLCQCSLKREAFL